MCMHGLITAGVRNVKLPTLSTGYENDEQQKTEMM